MNVQQFVAFQVGTELFAFPIQHVKEIIRLSRVTVVPQVKEYVQGIINLRGKIITVVNLHKLLRSDNNEVNAEEQRVIILEHNNLLQGFMVDVVSEVLNVPFDAIEPPPQLTGQAQQYLAGVAKVNERLLLLLDVDALVS